MLDVYSIGRSDRVSAEAPVPVVHSVVRHVALGGAANAAANVRSLTAGCDLIGAVGDDAQAVELREALTACDIVSRLAVTADRPTTTKTRIIANGSQVVRLDDEYRGWLPDPCRSQLVRAIRRLGPTNALLISDYAKGVCDDSVIREALRAAERASLPVVVDSKSARINAYRGATMVKLSSHDVEQNAEIFNPVTQARRLQSLLPGTAILVTLGANGMLLAEPGGRVTSMPTLARSVFDVTGAGDTVAATAATALAAGGSVQQAAELANIAAGIVVEKPYTATSTAAEIMAHGAQPSRAGARAARTTVVSDDAAATS